MARVTEHKQTRTVTVQLGEEVVEQFSFDLPYIRTLKGFLQGTWSLGEFGESMTGKNGFGDVDASTEIDGHTLILEFKQSFNKVDNGQVMKAIRQAKYGRTSTWFIEGDTNQPKRLYKVESTGTEGEFKMNGVLDVDMQTVCKHIADWEQWARRNSLTVNKLKEWAEVREIRAQMANGGEYDND